MSASPLATQRNVIYALFMRDLQTRFGGGGGGYLNYVITLCWPLAHIGLLLIIYSAIGRDSPLGQDATLFFATGLVPYMVFYYPSRFMMMSIMFNRPLTSFPVVKIFDILAARALVEIITGFGVVCVTAFVLYSLNHDAVPKDPATAVCALAASLFMAVGFGSFNAIMTGLFRVWIFVFIIFAVSLYIISGILFVVTALPLKTQYLLSWNPAVHTVAWFRSAYYSNYGSPLIPDKAYPFEFGAGLLLLALLLERYVLPRFAPA